MKWIEPTVFAKSCGNPDFRSIFGHQRAKNAGTNTKTDRGPETYPISINPRDEMNWANSFREKLWKPCLQTDGRTDRRTDGQTDGQTSGWIQYTPFPPSVERGYNKSYYYYYYCVNFTSFCPRSRWEILTFSCLGGECRRFVVLRPCLLTSDLWSGLKGNQQDRFGHLFRLIITKPCHYFKSFKLRVDE